MLNSIVLHISAGHGPAECQLAARHALQQLCREAMTAGCTSRIVEEADSPWGLPIMRKASSFRERSRASCIFMLHALALEPCRPW